MHMYEMLGVTYMNNCGRHISKVKSQDSDKKILHPEIWLSIGPPEMT